MKSRIEWVDTAKALCIFLVVLGHSHIAQSLKSGIYVFHIPLFFFISGLLFSFEKYPNYKEFIKKRLFQLVVPYFFFNAVTYLFWVFIGRKVGDDANLPISPFKPLIGILYGNDAGHYLEHCAPLWFLSCLFVVENIYYLVFKKLKKVSSKIIGIILFGMLGFLDYSYNPFRFPWGINVAIVMIVFYGTGSVLGINLLGNTHKRNYWLPISVLSFITILLIAKINGKIEVSVEYFGNYFYFIIGAFAGITMVISVSKFFQTQFNNLFFVQNIGRNTLIILTLHILAGSFVKGIAYYIFHLPLSIFQNEWIAIVYSILCIISLIPIMFFLNKYIPFVIGKNKL